MTYLEDGESSALTILRSGLPVEGRAIAANTGDVQLQLAGNALLEVDDPQRLFRIDLDSGELKGKSSLLSVSAFIELNKRKHNLLSVCNSKLERHFECTQ